MKKLLSIIAIFFSYAIFAQQTQEELFDYQRDWATYLPKGSVGSVVNYNISEEDMFNNGNLIYVSFNNFEGVLFDELLPIPTGEEGNVILGSINAEGEFDWVKKIQLGEDYTRGFLPFADEEDYLYVHGTTRDTINIGTTGTHQPTLTSLVYQDTIFFNGMPVVGTFPKTANYIAKCDTLGNRLWGTYIYGEKDMSGGATYLRKHEGHLYYFGYTNSKSGIATPGTYMSVAPSALPTEVTETYGVNFIMKFNANTGERLWGTYLPLLEEDFMTQPASNRTTISVDATGSIYFKSLNEYVRLTPEGVYDETLSNSDNLDYISDLYFDNSGNIFVLAVNKSDDDTNFGTSGTYKPSKTVDGELLLIKLSPSFEKIWASYLGFTPTGWEAAWSFSLTINEDVNNEILISNSVSAADNANADAFQTTFGGGVSDAAMMSFDMQTGQRNWFSYYGDSNQDRAVGIIPTAEGGFYLTGTSEGGDNIISEESLYTSEDFGVWYGHIQIPFVAKFTSTKTSSVDELPREAFKVYPNPSSDKVFVEAVSQWQNDVSLSLYTLQGKYLTTDVQATSTGYAIDVSSLPSGFYWLKVSTADGVTHYKLIKE